MRGGEGEGLSLPLLECHCPGNTRMGVSASLGELLGLTPQNGLSRWKGQLGTAGPSVITVTVCSS